MAPSLLSIFMLLFLPFTVSICVCTHVCLSLCLSCLFLPFSPVLCLSLPSPASSVKWWTCSPHTVCHCHPSLQSWRWQGWPGCVWSGRGPLAHQRRTTSAIFWKWRRRARYVSHRFFFSFFSKYREEKMQMHKLSRQNVIYQTWKRLWRLTASVFNPFERQVQSAFTQMAAVIWVRRRRRKVKEPVCWNDGRKQNANIICPPM